MNTKYIWNNFYLPATYIHLGIIIIHRALILMDFVYKTVVFFIIMPTKTNGLTVVQHFLNNKS